MAWGRPGRPIGIRASVSYKVLVSAILTLLLLAALSVLLSSNSNTAAATTSSASSLLLLKPYMSCTFLALKSNPHRTRLDLITKQATDHIALVNAYSSYARKLKLENSRLLRTFHDLSSNFSDLVVRFSPDDALRLFKKEVKDRVPPL